MCKSVKEVLEAECNNIEKRLNKLRIEINSLSYHEQSSIKGMLKVTLIKELSFYLSVIRQTIKIKEKIDQLDHRVENVKYNSHE